MRRRFQAAVFLFLVAAAALYGGAAYRGNTQSKVFHQSSCRHFTCKNCTVLLGSVDEAVERGFRPCQVCRPGGSSAAAAVDAGYSGNTNSRKFHESGCRYFSCKNCTAKFKTREAAIAAGYVPGGCCNP